MGSVELSAELAASLGRNELKSEESRWRTSAERGLSMVEEV